MGGQRTSTFPAGRVLGQRVDRRVRGGDGILVIVDLQQEVGEPLAGPAVQHRIGLGGQEGQQPAELLHGPQRTSPLSAALTADRKASLPRSIPASCSGSVTRSQSDSA